LDDDLERALGRVEDEVTFVAFFDALGFDRAAEVAAEDRSSSGFRWEPGSRGWENGTTQAFLGPAVAWVSDSKGSTEIVAPVANPWRRCADILFAGKHYE
jgi:hypothetical protein